MKNVLTDFNYLYGHNVIAYKKYYNEYDGIINV